MRKINVELPAHVRGALKYGANCYGEIKVKIREEGTDYAYGYAQCGAEWFVGQNGGRSVSGKACEILGGSALCYLEIPADSIVVLSEAQ
jgi:hypothetical protein